MPRAVKEKFRAQWGSERYAEYEEGRKHILSESHTDRQIGTYLNIDQIIAEEGGRDSKAAVAGAIRYAVACAKMGKKWTKWHRVTARRRRFLYCKEEHID
eukprot:7904304-Alexandrium_andersonii.AAC.1